MTREEAFHLAFARCGGVIPRCPGIRQPCCAWHMFQGNTAVTNISCWTGKKWLLLGGEYGSSRE